MSRVDRRGHDGIIVIGNHVEHGVNLTQVGMLGDVHVSWTEACGGILGLHGLLDTFNNCVFRQLFLLVLFPPLQSIFDMIILLGKFNYKLEVTHDSSV